MQYLRRYCDGLIEASWLLVLIGTSLFFTLDSANVFEAGKVALLRSGALIGLAAWAVKLISQGGMQFEYLAKPKSPRAFFALPLALPITILSGVYLVSSLFSISMRASFLGSYQRLHGLTTIFAFIALFMLIVANLRRREQVERLLSVLILSGVFIDLYAILQHFNLDPVSWQLSTTERAISTIGHPIFTGAFLCMIQLFVFGRLILAVQSFLEKRTSRITDLLRIGIYILLTIINLLAVWYTNSRGPLIGFLFGLAFLGLLLLAHWQLRRLFYVFLALAILGSIFIVVLNIPGGPLSALRDSPLVGPIGHILDSESGTGRTRILMWQGMSQLVTPHAPIEFPDGSRDMWNFLRPLVGYGPETLKLTFEDYYKAESFALENYALLTDHAHNEFWDTLAFYGIFGLFAEYFLFLSAFHFGLARLGFINSTREIKLYWGLAIVGGLVGMAVSVATKGIEYLGLGLPIGLLSGPIGILIFRMFRPVTKTVPQLAPWQAVTVISILAAILSHYVEILFGIPVAPTRSLMWVFLGLLLVVGWIIPARPQETYRKASNRIVELRQVGFASIALILAMTMVGQGFISSYLPGGNALEVLINAMTIVPLPQPHSSTGILWFFFGGVAFGALFLQLENDSLDERKPEWANMLAVFGLSVIFSLATWFLRASQMFRFRSGNFDTVEQFISTFLWLGIYFSLIVVFLLFIWALTLMDKEFGSLQYPARLKPLSIVGCILIPLLTLAIIISLNIRPFLADMLFTQVKGQADNGEYELALSLSDEMVKLAPNEDTYQTQAAITAIVYAKTTQDVALKGYLFKYAQEKLNKALDLNPLFINNIISLARLYREWGDAATDAGLKSSLYYQANAYYSTGLDGRPARVDLWQEWAAFLVANGDLQGAWDKIATIKATDSTYAPVYSLAGKLYFAEAENEIDPDRRVELLRKALQEFQTQIDLLKATGKSTALAYFDIGDIYKSLGQEELAQAFYLQAADEGTGEYQWQLYKKIADTSALLNDTESQREYLQKAIEIAPENEKSALQAELDKLTPENKP